jgi:hypothetical protein
VTVTWNIRDLGKPATPADPLAPLPPTPEATPRVALEALLAATPDDAWTPSPELRRELAHAGLIDDTTWAAYRRLLTRGLIAE